MLNRRAMVCVVMFISVFPVVSAHGERQIHVEQITVRCINDETKKFDVKPSAYFTKKCEGKTKCSAAAAGLAQRKVARDISGTKRAYRGGRERLDRLEAAWITANAPSEKPARVSPHIPR